MATLSPQAVLTNDQMARADAAAIRSGTPGFSLMQRAGGLVAEQVIQRYSPQPVLVLCGPGNNGGDGFIIAARLRDAGWPVQLALLGDAQSLKGDAARAAQAWNGEILPLSSEMVQGKLVVDALFGTGLSRDVEGIAAGVLQAVVESDAAVVAVDIPSGVDGDTGAVKGIAAPASLTVTFHRKKRGHVLQPGRSLCGEVVVADIGIAADALGDEPVALENDPSLWAGALPWPKANSHKYTRGHALVQGGGVERTGAARLAAKAALRAGSGAVTVLCDRESLPVYARALEAVMTRLAEDDAAFKEAISDPRISAALIGPAAGIGEPTRIRVLALLEANIPCVLDADALTSFESNPQELFSVLRGKAVILTPHEGEFARLFGQLEGDKITRAVEAAQRSGAVVLLKGSDTVIAAPDGRAVVNTVTTPFLATAGSGDVLAGICTGLAAGGMNPFDAACAGVWMHGMAGLEFGPGLTADDLPAMLPDVLRFLRFR